MVSKKVTGTAGTGLRDAGSKQKVRLPLFHKENYLWMGIGAAVIALGMLLMMGGKNDNSNVFDYSVVYSTRRITFGPILIILGLLVEVYAIFKRPKVQQ